MLAASNPRWANSVMAALRIAARVSIERCCSALLRGRSRRAAVSLVFFAISLSVNIVPNRTPSQVSRPISGPLVGHLRRAPAIACIRKLPRGCRKSSWDDLRLAAEFRHHRLSHRKLLDLAGHSGREALHEPDVAGDLVVRDPILTELADTFLVGGGTGLRHDPGTEFFAI